MCFIPLKFAIPCEARFVLNIFDFLCFFSLIDYLCHSDVYNTVDTGKL